MQHQHPPAPHWTPQQQQDMHEWMNGAEWQPSTKANLNATLAACTGAIKALARRVQALEDRLRTAPATPAPPKTPFNAF
jgi:hypothetical protein